MRQLPRGLPREDRLTSRVARAAPRPPPSRYAAVRTVARYLCRAAAPVALALLASESGRAATPVDLELVLAVDVSSSVDGAEWQLQRAGLAGALRHPDVAAALRSLPDGIAMAVVQWSSYDRQALVVPWSGIRDDLGLAAFAERVATMPRRFTWGQTMIGEALAFSAAALTTNAFAGRRRVIDVSGDGGARFGSLPRRWRDSVVAQGITVNGLAILTDDPRLDAYYRANVIGGFGAFVIKAESLDDFTAAMVKKLLQEFAEPLAQNELPGRSKTPSAIQ